MAKEKRTNNAKQKTTQKTKAIYKCWPILEHVDVTSSLILQYQPAGLDNK